MANLDFPAGCDVMYDAFSGEWVGHWPEADHAVFPPAHERNGKHFELVNADGSIDDSDYRCRGWVSLRGLLCGPQCMQRRLRSEIVPDTCILDFTRLFPEENLLSLQDPPRYSAHLLSVPDDDTATMRRNIQSAWTHSMSSAFFHLYNFRCVNAGCERRLPDFPVARALPERACAWCKDDKLALRVCCAKAVPQLRPVFPRAFSRAFFAMVECDGDCSAAAPVEDLTAFDAHQALRYDMTCRSQCFTKAFFDELRPLFAGLPGMPPLPRGTAPCPASVTEIVCDYLGRRTLAVLLSPLFSYVCEDHPSGLDLLCRTPLYAPLSTPGKRLQRIANMCHYYHVLVPFCLSHVARADSLRVLHHNLRDSIAAAAAAVALPMDIAAPNHAASHRLRMDSWYYLYRLYHSSAEFVRSVYESVYDAGAPARWSVYNWPLAVRAMCLVTTASASLEPLTMWYRVPIIARWPEMSWKEASSPCDAVLGSYTIHFKTLHGLNGASGPWCEPSCCPPFFTPSVAGWVEAVCASPRLSRKRSRRARLAARPWESTPETVRLHRLLMVYETESDSDQTLPSFSPTRHPNYNGDTTDDDMPADAHTGDTTEDELDVMGEQHQTQDTDIE